MQLLWVLFVTGLAAGFGHCIGMCGGLVAGCSFAGCRKTAAGSGVAAFQALFHSGRLAAYVVFGLLLGGLGSLPRDIAATRPFQSWLQVAAGILMILMGLVIGFARTPVTAAALGGGPGWFARSAGALMRRSSSTAAAFPLGLLIGLLPCGMTVAIGLKALATGSAVSGAAVMLAFGLGTVPALLGFGLASGVFGTRASGVMLKVGAALVVVVGVLTVAKGIGHLGLMGSMGSMRSMGPM